MAFNVTVNTWRLLSFVRKGMRELRSRQEPLNTHGFEHPACSFDSCMVMEIRMEIRILGPFASFYMYIHLSIMKGLSPFRSGPLFVPLLGGEMAI